MNSTAVFSAQVVRKQRVAVKVIADANESLKEQIVLENKQTVNGTTSEGFATLAELQDAANTYVQRITETQLQKAALVAANAKLEDVIAEQRRESGGPNACSKKVIQGRRRLKILEDQLQAASVRRDHFLLAQSQSASRVQALHLETTVTQDAAAKTRARLARRKNDLLDLVADICEAHEAREKALALIAHTRGQMDRETAVLEQEWRKLTQILDLERLARDEQRRREHAQREQQMANLFAQDFAAPTLGPRARGPGSGTGVAGVTQAATAAPAQPQRAGALGAPAAASAVVGGGPGAPATHAQRVQACAEAFQKISGATGYSSMEELAAELVAMQQRNFMLFKHMTQAQLETEANRQAAAGFRREAAATRDAVAAARQAQKCAEFAREVGERTDKVQSDTAALARQLTDRDRLLEELGRRVLAMTEDAGCIPLEVTDGSLAPSHGAHGNLMQHLGLLEKRVADIAHELTLQSLASEASQVSSERSSTRAPGSGSKGMSSSAPPPPSVYKGRPRGRRTRARNKGTAEGSPSVQLPAVPLDRDVLRERVRLAMAAAK
ncbi:ODA5 [Auxenochlorella protothecoides x Auxenochlorella symbiontica]